MNEEVKMRILGIDPGTQVAGYGLVEIVGKKISIITMGVISIGKFEEINVRLKYLHERALHLIDEYKPDVLSIEAPFYGKNVQSMLKLGRAQGVVIAAALYRSLPVFEYAPLLVKQSITGMGRASKEQVAYFLQKVYHIEEIPRQLDATDAIAVAICHYIQQSNPVKKSDFKNWGDFIKKNPDRVK
jgi:crossover junction endodeoxyribonuclease RuvC